MWPAGASSILGLGGSFWSLECLRLLLAFAVPGCALCDDVWRGWHTGVEGCGTWLGRLGSQAEAGPGTAWPLEGMCRPVCGCLTLAPLPFAAMSSQGRPLSSESASGARHRGHTF